MIRELSEHPERRGTGRMLFGLARPHRRVLVGGLVATTVASASGIAATALVGALVDAALRGAGRRAVALALAGIGVAVVQVVATGYGQAWLARAGEYVVRDLRDRIAARLLFAPLRFIERHRAGDLVQRGTAEIAALSTFVRQSLGQLVATTSTLVVAVVVLSGQSWQLLLAALIGCGPASWWLTTRFAARAGPAFAAEAAAEADVMAGVAEVVRTRSLLRQATPVGRRHFLGRLDERGERALAAQMRTVVVARWINAMALVEVVSLAALLGLGALLVQAGSVTIGVVVTFVLAGRVLFASFADLSGLVADAQEAATGLSRARDLIEATDPGAGAGTGAGVRRRPTDRRLVADSVVFGYGGKAVLDGVDLVVEPGDRVCLVGRTGAGKSTLAKVLAGLYEPEAGSVRVGGLELSSLSPDRRARLVAYVPQQVQLGPGTLREELQLADSTADDAGLLDAAGRLGLGGWLSGLPAGLDTAVQGGLSAGERQLVGLVRVALRDAPVLVLDEATSDLDPATAVLVERALYRLAADRAVVVVAHRPETIAASGRVVTVGPLTARA